MAASLFLTQDEVIELTDRQTGPAQVKRLKMLKIPYMYKPGGRVKVLRSTVESRPATRQPTEPDFSIFDKHR